MEEDKILFINDFVTPVLLKPIMFQYGDVMNLIISSKRNGSAIVEFKDRGAAVSRFFMG